jgi:hypothetical protein
MLILDKVVLHDLLNAILLEERRVELNSSLPGFHNIIPVLAELIICDECIVVLINLVLKGVILSTRDGGEDIINTLSQIIVLREAVVHGCFHIEVCSAENGSSIEVGRGVSVNVLASFMATNCLLIY